MHLCELFNAPIVKLSFQCEKYKVFGMIILLKYAFLLQHANLFNMQREAHIRFRIKVPAVVIV